MVVVCSSRKRVNLAGVPVDHHRATLSNYFIILIIVACSEKSAKIEINCIGSKVPTRVCNELINTLDHLVKRNDRIELKLRQDSVHSDKGALTSETYQIYLIATGPHWTSDSQGKLCHHVSAQQTIGMINEFQSICPKAEPHKDRPSTQH